MENGDSSTKSCSSQVRSYEITILQLPVISWIQKQQSTKRLPLVKWGHESLYQHLVFGLNPDQTSEGSGMSSCETCFGRDRCSPPLQIQ